MLERDQQRTEEPDGDERFGHHHAVRPYHDHLRRRDAVEGQGAGAAIGADIGDVDDVADLAVLEDRRYTPSALSLSECQHVFDPGTSNRRAFVHEPAASW